MKSLEESVVTAMDGSDRELFPFLPYLLQDVWEIGSDPEVIVGLIARHCASPGDLRLLDPGCGKGAVSVRAAQAFGCRCYGIDGVPEFVSEAREKAVEYGVDRLCRFEVGDIRESVRRLPAYDVIVLGSIGPVFGDVHATLTAVSHCLAAAGIVIIDDGYIEDGSPYTHPLVPKQKELLDQIRRAGMELIDAAVIDPESLRASNDALYALIRQRCHELMEAHPARRKLFADYLEAQERENDVLENRIVCAAMAIARKR